MMFIKYLKIQAISTKQQEEGSQIPYTTIGVSFSAGGIIVGSGTFIIVKNTTKQKQHKIYYKQEYPKPTHNSTQDECVKLKEQIKILEDQIITLQQQNDYMANQYKGTHNTNINGYTGEAKQYQDTKIKALQS